MAEKVGKVKKKKGKMYYVSKKGDIMETTLSRKGGKTGREIKTTSKAKIEREKREKRKKEKKSK